MHLIFYLIYNYKVQILSISNDQINSEMNIYGVAAFHADSDWLWCSYIHKKAIGFSLAKLYVIC